MLTRELLSPYDRTTGLQRFALHSLTLDFLTNHIVLAFWRVARYKTEVSLKWGLGGKIDAPTARSNLQKNNYRQCLMYKFCLEETTWLTLRNWIELNRCLLPLPRQIHLL